MTKEEAKLRVNVNKNKIKNVEEEGLDSIAFGEFKIRIDKKGKQKKL